MWMPSGFPVDRVGRMDLTDEVLRLGHDGTVVRDLNISLRIAADFDLRRFPFDRQRLEFAVESFIWTEDDLVFVADSKATDFAHDFSIPEWHIERVGERIESSTALRSATPSARRRLVNSLSYTNSEISKFSHKLRMSRLTVPNIEIRRSAVMDFVCSSPLRYRWMRTPTSIRSS